MSSSLNGAPPVKKRKQSTKGPKAAKGGPKLSKAEKEKVKEAAVVNASPSMQSPSLQKESPGMCW